MPAYPEYGQAGLVAEAGEVGWLGQARPGLVRLDQARPGQAIPGRARSGKSRTGQGRPSEIKLGQDRSVQGRPG